MSAGNRSAGTEALVTQPSHGGQGRQSSASGNDASGNSQRSGVALSVEQSAAPDETAKANTQAQTEQADQYKLRDLIAQEDMAYWAMWMVLAALLTFLVTSIGTFLIWRQVKLTRQAVEDTGEATVAMQEANEIASDTARRQLRAYVMGTDHSVTHLYAGGRPKFIVKLHNFGQTPASEVRCRTIVRAINGDPDETRIMFREARQAVGLSNSLIGPTDFHVHVNGMDQGSLGSDASQMIERGEIIMTFAGVISYRDVFGKRHLTTFKYFLSPDTLNLKDTAYDLTACGRGNKAN